MEKARKIQMKGYAKRINDSKTFVADIKNKIKICENCKDKKEAKKCITDLVSKT